MRTSSSVIEPDGDAKSGHVRSVARALTMLSALIPGRSIVTELASAADLPVPTAIRILKTMEASGYVSRDADGTYSYGPSAMRVAVKLDPRGAISHTIRLATQELSAKFNETAAFFMRDRNERVCVESAESTREVRWVCREGQRMPVHLGAAGHVLVAFGIQDAEAQQSTGTGGAAYGNLQLTAIRQMGYATTELESTNDSWGIAVPVYEEGVFYGALACGIPLSRATETLRVQVTEACLAGAKAASSGLQHDNYVTRTMVSKRTR
jgi:IclR family KDG regulon transcriptional repressor